MAVAELTDQLAARVRQMEGTREVRRSLELLPVVADLVPGGMYAGAAYSVIGSTSLAMTLLAGPSSAGAWCGVVGVPSFGAEAAAAVGVDLSRTVLVPDPAEQWLSVTSTLVDVLSVVVLKTPSTVHDAEASRLAARLRQRGTTLIAVHERGADSWPRAEARLEITHSAWVGLGEGHGHLQARQVTVSATGKWGRPRETDLWLAPLAGTDVRRRIAGVSAAERQAHGGESEDLAS